MGMVWVVTKFRSISSSCATIFVVDVVMNSLNSMSSVNKSESPTPGPISTIANLLVYEYFN